MPIPKEQFDFLRSFATYDEYLQVARPYRVANPQPTIPDAELVTMIREAPEAAEFTEQNLLEYSRHYEGEIWQVVKMVQAHCRDRLEKRDAGKPHFDDPVGHDLAKQGKVRGGSDAVV